jgi:hypothetical protein
MTEPVPEIMDGALYFYVHSIGRIFFRILSTGIKNVVCYWNVKTFRISQYLLVYLFLTKIFLFATSIVRHIFLTIWEYGSRDPSPWPRGTLYPQTLCSNFDEKRRSLGRYRSLTDSCHGALFFFFPMKIYFFLPCISNIGNTSHEEETSNNRRKETLASPT